ncbi:preprotein translocase subunit SecG [Sandarakinorhabdus sp. DWP1-3-1]|uniref:preprotein translocase subunit SecG n=1 Tax=Sandarakinorhabdus sp. DWP1-3-1 TaxID=2804627 RepID=UPI003CE9B116
MITFLLVVHTLIALALVGVILLQRSEGGGLGIGGGTGGGLMTARGAANLLTRSTTVLATLFILSSIVLAVLAAGTNKPKSLDTSLATSSAPAVPVQNPATLPAGPLPGLPGAPAPTTAPATTPAPTPATPPADTGVPLAR